MSIRHIAGTFFADTGAREIKSGVVLFEERSVASKISCAHRCALLKLHILIVVFDNGICKCLKEGAPVKGIGEEDETLSGSFLKMVSEHYFLFLNFC